MERTPAMLPPLNLFVIDIIRLGGGSLPETLIQDAKTQHLKFRHVL